MSEVYKFNDFGKINDFNDFLKRMRAKFPANLKDDADYEIWAQDCTKELYNPKVDYAKLYSMVVKYNPNENFVPGTPWLYKQQTLCYKTEAKKEQKNGYLHPKIYNPIYKEVQNTDCFPIGTTDSQILKTYEKLFPNTQGWEIVGEN